MKPTNKYKVQAAIALLILPIACANPAQATPVRPAAVSVKAVDPTIDFIKNLRPTYTAKTRLAPLTLKEILYSVGFRGQDLKEAWGTAMKESTGRPLAHNRNKRTGDNSYGLFQINMIGSLGPARLEQFNLKSNKDLFDPYTNAKIAYIMSDGGKDWSAWHGLTDSTLSWMKKFPK